MALQVKRTTVPQKDHLIFSVLGGKVESLNVDKYTKGIAVVKELESLF